MSAEIAVMSGLTVTMFILFYVSFELKESETEFWKHIGLLFFFLGIIFMNLVSGAVMLMVDNNLTYMKDSIATWGLFAVNWLSAGVLIIWIIYMLFITVQFLFDWVQGKVKKEEVF
jgi:hypothetical protein